MPDRHQMLISLEGVCKNCCLCELGWQKVSRNNTEKDPHVFSDYPAHARLPRYMVIGQNPGWNEICEGKPFVGAAGKNFTDAITRNGLERADFYISNLVKCCTSNNIPPTQEHINACESIIKLEIGIIKPKLIIALGSIAYSALCPKSEFTPNLGKLTESKYGPKVYAIYHPSPLNLSDESRREQFNKDVAKLCKLIKVLNIPF